MSLATGRTPEEAKPSTIDRAEIEKFSAMAESWWDPSGKFRPLHRLNPVRVGFIRDRVASRLGRDPNAPAPLAGVTLLDIGCGGGLITEPMTRLGATVTGIDASEPNIGIARAHAERSGLKVAYLSCAAEDLVKSGQRFDVVLALEVIEHVADIDAFLGACENLMKPDGVLILATLNRTLKSFAFAIVGAEYVLRWLPRGTHDWSRFVRPAELARALRRRGLAIGELVGVGYNPLRDNFALSRDLGVNFMLLAAKG
jgi:2-polyprenyl-6-hydroxyphenyl methylase / 3-demethylubiquinone-9 3-methyltransferase